MHVKCHGSILYKCWSCIYLFFFLKDENNKRNSDREYSVTVLMYDVSCILMFIYHVILIVLIFLFLLVSQLKMQYQIES